MKEELINLRLPQTYQEGLIEFKEGLDSEPEWPKLQEMGYSLQYHKKLMKLVTIESMKYQLKENMKNQEITDEIINECKNLINKAIEEYNQI